MEWTKSQRGFKQGENQTDLNGTEYHLCESSLAFNPAIRLYIHTDDNLHLSIEQARELASSILELCENHYQTTQEEQ